MEDSFNTVIDLFGNKFICQRNARAMEKLHQYHVFMLKCFCLGSGDHLSFSPAPEVKVPDVTAVVLQKEESGLAPGTVVPGLRGEHRRWPVREHTTWVRCMSLE